MRDQEPRYSAEETARRGDEIYERHIRPQVEADQRGKVVAIDVDSGAYALDDNALAASERLLAEHPDAEIWCVRIGHRALHRVGSRPPGSFSSQPWTCDVGERQGGDFRHLRATVTWDGEPRYVEKDVMGATPLIGMGLIYGYDLQVHAVRGGSVVIRAPEGERR